MWLGRCRDRMKGEEKKMMLDVGLFCGALFDPEAAFCLTAPSAAAPSVLRDTSSQQMLDLPAVSPSSCSNMLTGVCQPLCQSQDLHLLD